MSNLVITIIAIALFVAISAGGIVYINVGLVSTRQNASLVATGFVTYVSEYHSYKMNNNNEPPMKNASGWSDDINMLRVPAGMDWSYDTKTAGSFFCLSGNIADEGFYNSAKSDLQNNFNSVFIGNSCGVTTSDYSFSSKQFKAFTVWLDSEYISDVSTSQTPSYSLKLVLTYANTGATILGDRLYLYQGEDTFIDVQLFSNSASVSVNDLDFLPDATIEFVCSDGSVGCEDAYDANPLRRRLKINAVTEFDNKELNITVNAGSGTAVRTLKVHSGYHFSCNKSDPLDGVNIDTGIYLIGNGEGDSDVAKAQLLCLSQNQTASVLSADYRMTANVQFNGDKDFVDWDGDGVVDGSGANGWISFGTDVSPFTGSFNGDNHSIENLHVVRNSDYQGLFGYASNGSINNLKVVNSFVAGDNYSGMIAGYADSVTMSNVHAIGLSSGDDFIGGLIGEMNAGSISDSSSVNNVLGNLYVGGLIGRAINASISTSNQDLGSVSGASYVGGLIGQVASSTISETVSSGSVTTISGYVGGLIGEITGATSSISKSISNSNVIVSGSSVAYAGGLVGSVEATIHESASEGSVSSSYGYVGGLVGELTGSGSQISSAYSIADVMANGVGITSSGGLVGYAEGMIINSYAKGSVDVTSTGDSVFVGGLVGEAPNTVIENSYASGEIKASALLNAYIGGLVGDTGLISGDLTIDQSYAAWTVNPTANVTSGTSYLGGLVGSNRGVLLINNYSNSCEYVNDGAVNACTEGVSRSIKLDAVNGFWDDNIWEDYTDYTPKLEWQVAGNSNSEPVWICNSGDPFAGMETDAGVYLIGGAVGNSVNAKAQLLCLSQNQNTTVLGSDYRLTANVTFNADETLEDWNGDGVPDGSSTSGWLTWGTKYSEFTGVFDGGSNNINNLYINKTTSSEVGAGLFAYADGAEIRNIKLNNVYVNAESSGGMVFAGSLLGKGDNATVVENSYATSGLVTVFATANRPYAGGLIGYLEDSSLNGGHTNLTLSVVSNGVDYSYAGGVVAIAQTSNISNSHAEGNVSLTATGTHRAGGLVGFMKGDLSSSYAAGSVTSSGENTGGLVGYYYIGEIKNSYSSGSVSGTNSIGGLIGSSNNITVENCYASGNVSGGYYLGGLIGYSGSSSNIYTSYSLNSNYTAIGSKAVNLTEYCSYDYDVGCDITYSMGSIKSSWSDSVWESIEDQEPKLEWQVDGDIESAYLWTCNSINPLSEFDISAGNYLIGGLTGNEKLAKQQLLCLSQNQTSNVLRADYALTANVNFNVNEALVDWNSDGVSDGASTTGFQAIGDETNEFMGAFDGANYSINNLYINNSSKHQGLFGYTDGGAEVKNLTINGVDITANHTTGSIIGYANATSIDNCHVNSGSVKAKSRYGSDQSDVGGLVGSAWSNVVISNSSSNANVTGAWDDVGGLVGLVYGSGSIIENSKSSGTVDGNYGIGGLVGYFRGNIIRNSYSSANILAANYLGGLVGYMSSGYLQNTYFAGNANCAGGDKGSLIGYNRGSNTIQSYALSNTLTAVGNQSYDIYDYCSYTFDSGCKSAYEIDSVKHGWDDLIWEKLEDSTPKLEWENLGDIDSRTLWQCNPASPLDGMDMDAGVYLIGNLEADSNLAKEQLLCLSNNADNAVRSADYRLMANIIFNADEAQEDWDYNGSPDGGSTEGWLPLGISGSVYQGNFDGNGFVINNLYINRAINYQGFFGSARYSEIKDLGFMNANVTGNRYTASLAGYARDVNISNVYSEGVNINGGQNSGGLIGYINNSSVDKSHAVGIITSANDDSGGLIGQAISSSVSDSYASVTVSGRDDIGGLLGAISGVNVTSSYATGTVSASRDDVGGLIGSAASSSYINASYYSGNVNGGGNRAGGLLGSLNASSIVNSYATGVVNLVDDNAGGLVGRASRGANIDNSYASSYVSGDRGVGGLVGYANGGNGRIYINNSYAYWYLAPSGSNDVGGLVGRQRTLTVNNPGGVCEYVDEGGSPSQCSNSNIFSIHGSYSPPRLVSDGSDDYIDTGLYWSPTTKVIIEGKGATANPDTYDKMTGTLNNYTWFGYARGYLYAGLGGSNAPYDWIPYDQNDHIFIIDLPNSKLYLDSNEVDYTGSKPSGRPLFLFARESSGSPLQHMSFNLLKAEIWQDGSRVRNFTPQADGRLLDEVNNVYYGNDGSGSFTVDNGGSSGWSYDIWDNLGTDPTPTFK